jgi:hypothetical protein
LAVVQRVGTSADTARKSACATFGMRWASQYAIFVLTYWDAGKRSFVVEPGRISIMLSASSADARIEKTIEVKEK